ncbi:hypothetical protein BEH94_02500 [Candidatus Altiarchaeales archaeon WOR_SM1_SCG]|nr:hypothetical protein BEH94_02500 [Candidatus Altiarchaeales archaeon WOR_SM1_SCG]
MNHSKLKKDFEKEVEKITGQIKEKYKPDKIILFGSSAKGNVTENSDIDMLIIKDTNKRRVERIREVLSIVDYDLPFEPVVFTNEELRKRLALNDFFIKNILKEGKILYGQKV